MSKDSGIENTTARAMGGHMNFLETLPGMIEASERRGQADLVESESLPTETRPPREVFESLGFTFGDPFPEDRLFRPATLPRGWKKERTDHSMWSRIVDEKGRTRVEVFYKAAFYDRRADMRLASRYKVQNEYSRDYTSVYVVVLDGEAEIHRTETFTGAEREVFDAEGGLRKAACEWLTANRPGWDDPVKAWED